MDQTERTEFHRQPDAPGIAVLIVDDDPAVRNVLRAMMEPKGYRFLLAASGEEAMTLSRAYPGEIHILISDVNMPRMNGVDLAVTFLEERPGSRALLISGYGTEQIKTAGVRLPFLRKPFVAEELWRRLEELLSLRCARPVQI